MNYYLGAFKKYAVFQGRAARKEYWMFILFDALATLALFIIDLLIGFGFLTTLYILGSLIPALALVSRRLHDTGRAAWWILIGFIPFIGGFILLIFTVLDSQTGSNIFGPCPKGDSYVSKRTKAWLIAIIVCIAVLPVIMAGLSVWGAMKVWRYGQQAQTNNGPSGIIYGEN